MKRQFSSAAPQLRRIGHLHERPSDWAAGGVGVCYRTIRRLIFATPAARLSPLRPSSDPGCKVIESLPPPTVSHRRRPILTPPWALACPCHETAATSPAMTMARKAGRKRFKSVVQMQFLTNINPPKDRLPRSAGKWVEIPIPVLSRAGGVRRANQPRTAANRRTSHTG